jgi:signal transduction histidine kinase
VLDRAARLTARLTHVRLLLTEREELRRRLNDRELERRRLTPLAELGASTRDLAGATVRALADVLAFGRRVARDLPAPDLNREYLEALVSEVERLERLWSEQVELASLGTVQLVPSDLNALLEELEQGVSERIMKRKGRIIRRLAAGLPPLLIDSTRLRRVLERILAALLESLPVSGRLKIETRRAGDQVQIHLAADGPRRAGETLDRLFGAFTDAASPGRGPLGPAVRQIVREHGGEIGVRADAEWPALYLLTLPIRGNQERRRPSTDRREGRDRRAA